MVAHAWFNVIKVPTVKKLLDNIQLQTKDLNYDQYFLIKNVRYYILYSIEFQRTNEFWNWINHFLFYSFSIQNNGIKGEIEQSHIFEQNTIRVNIIRNLNSC